MSLESDFFTNNIVLFAALGIIIALILRMEIKRAISGFKTITPAQAVQLINKDNALLIDIREDNELAQGSIRGAKHYALSVLKQRVEELKEYVDQPVIAYCKMGNRSNEACSILKQNDFNNVMSLKGGIEGWKTENLPVVKK
ncbi:MAG: rhodanese-like domain-containing protein [Pseudomonadota bacterium]